MHRTLRPAIALALLIAVVPQLGCSGKFDSPEACFRTLQIAGHNKDMPGMCACLTAESQETLAGMLIFAGGMLKMQKGGEAVSAVLEQHGVTADAVQAQTMKIATQPGDPSLGGMAALVKDKAAFIGDMFMAMQKLGGQAASFIAKFEEQIAGELQNVKVDGDQATAVVVTKKSKEPLEFRKTAAGWKLHINLGGTSPGVAIPPA